MRVKISYGVDINDVPDTVRGLVHDSLDRLITASDMLKRILNDLDDCEENISHALKELDRARKKLSETDLSLEDVHSIMIGLESYYNGEQDVPKRRPTMDPGGNPAQKT